MSENDLHPVSLEYVASIRRIAEMALDQYLELDDGKALEGAEKLAFFIALHLSEIDSPEALITASEATLLDFVTAVLTESIRKTEEMCN